MSATISFGFKKKAEKRKLEDSKLRDEATRDEKEEVDIVQGFEAGVIQSTVKKEVKKLVIPLGEELKGTFWARLKEKKDERKEKINAKDNVSSQAQLDQPPPSQDELENLAVKEIIGDTRNAQEMWEKRGEKGSLGIIISQNEDISESNSNLGKEASLEDYEDVPIDEFGMAMLRGMGLKDEDVKKSSEIGIGFDPWPVGLGLGATRKAVKDPKGVEERDDPPAELKKGINVCILQGPHRGLYGQVEGLDPDTARVIVKLAISGSVETISELAVKIVGSKEYRESSKILNKEKYDKYKSSQALQNGNNISPQNGQTKDQKEEEKKIKIWVRPHLRVRLVDSVYKRGKYYKEKVTVTDVPAPDICTCKTKDGKLLEDVSPSMLETVIPRGDEPLVMILRGKYDGQIGVLEEKDKRRCVATLRIWGRSKVVHLDYDDVCEFVGDPALLNRI
ncbi:unnamed protein product [Darwinula stevensoni]|uniref:KOW domain-containing protein n=1 Tax=Darwinula stevensoni TaxID=69355 RepID=A0A7R9A3C2_9CRUS|nr:unnamed protein product [Darwinula stevensoni]CAG0881022.1 unnamed protein product [Darwinula stevensoni]